MTVGDGGKPPPWIADVDTVILTVRDDAITPLATALAPRHTVVVPDLRGMGLSTATSPPGLPREPRSEPSGREPQQCAVLGFTRGRDVHQRR